MNHTRRPGWPLAAALLALLAGCGEAVAPAGTPSAVSVHAYVDADGSGGISDGDVFIPGVVVRLEPTSGTAGGALEATTNVHGVALFENVMPGSYRVVAAGGVPEGAVLATASAPVIVAPYQGGQLATEFRYVFNPGGISGRITHATSGAPAPGIAVTLYAGESATGEPVATTTTDAQGFFSFGVLRPGRYTYRVSALPTMQIEGGDTQTVTVQAQQTAEAVVRFTGSLITSIAQVRALGGPTSPAFGETVAFEGVVTAGVGIFSTSATGNQFNVQDATGGILVLDTPLAGGPQEGDSVRVVGRLQVSGGELLIRQPTITVLASNRPLPAPLPLTPAQVASSSAADPLQGSLVQVRNVVVTAVSGTPTTTAYNVTVTDQTGGNQFVVRVGSAATGIPQTFWQVGNAYNITGPLANFNGAQIKVRSQADVTAGSAFPTIAQVRAAGGPTSPAMGEPVTFEGVVTAGVGLFSTSTTGNQFNVQDATGGILVLDTPLAGGPQQGDSVRITGRPQISSGELLIRQPTITVLATARPLPAPITVSAAHVAASTAADSLQGSLVRVENVRVTAVSGTATSTSYNVTVVDQDSANQFVVRVGSAATGIPQTYWQVGSSYDIVGPLANFTGGQIKVRGTGDVAPAGTLPMAIAQARQLAPQTGVTVTGIVTAGVGVFSTNATSNQFNVQDATGGILVLQVPLASGIQLGDSVTVRGNTQVSAGELALTGSPTVTVHSSGHAVPAPITITAERVAASTAADPLQGALVRVEGVRVDSLGTGATAYNVFATGADGGRFIIRVGSAATGIARDFWQVGQTYTIIGPLANFNGAQIKVRMPSDAVAVGGAAGFETSALAASFIQQRQPARSGAGGQR